MTTTTSDRTEGGSRLIGLAVGVLVAVVVAAIILAIALGNGEEAADTSAADAARIPTSGALREVSFAEAAGTALEPFASEAGDAAEGELAPTITASYFDNTEVTIDLADGQPRVIMFMAHWCPHCQAEVAALSDYFATTELRSDVELLPVSTAVDQGAPNYPPSRWLIGEGWPVPVLRDSASNDLAMGFGVTGYPFYVVVNADGEVVSRRSGAVPVSGWDGFLDLALS